jgi:hypothetical protein
VVSAVAAEEHGWRHRSSIPLPPRGAIGGPGTYAAPGEHGWPWRTGVEALSRCCIPTSTTPPAGQALLRPSCSFLCSRAPASRSSGPPPQLTGGGLGVAWRGDETTDGRIPSPTGDLSQRIRVRGRWRRWATTALVRRGRWKGGGGVLQYPRGTVHTRYCSRATVPARYCSRGQEAAAGGLGLVLEADNL